MTVSRTQFDASLDLLAGPLRERALRLRRYVLSARRDVGIAEAVSLAFDAGYAGDQRAAETMLARAEELAQHTRSARRPPPPWKLVSRGMHGQLLTPATKRASAVDLRRSPSRDEHAGRHRPLIVATDASYKSRFAGWGYVSGDGHWGCSGMPTRGRLNPTGKSGAMVSELRAVYMAMSDLKEVTEMTLLLDSLAAIRFLNMWKGGNVDEMPDGYSLRPRFTSAGATGTPTLVKLAHDVAARPGLTFNHVPGHSGHPLNEAADGLAHFARRCMCGDQDGDELALRKRATGLVAAFLYTWHEVGEPHP